MGKIKEFFTKSKKRLAMSVTAVLTFALGAVGCFATETGLSSQITSITGAISGSFTGANVASVIVAALGIAVPLVLVWFAFRFIWKKAKGSLKRGV